VAGAGAGQLGPAIEIGVQVGGGSTFTLSIQDLKRHVGLFGPTGAGKTTVIKATFEAIAEYNAERGRAVPMILFDYTGNLSAMAFEGEALSQEHHLHRRQQVLSDPNKVEYKIFSLGGKALTMCFPLFRIADLQPLAPLEQRERIIERVKVLMKACGCWPEAHKKGEQTQSSRNALVEYAKDLLRVLTDALWHQLNRNPQRFPKDIVHLARYIRGLDPQHKILRISSDEEEALCLNEELDKADLLNLASKVSRLDDEKGLRDVFNMAEGDHDISFDKLVQTVRVGAVPFIIIDCNSGRLSTDTTSRLLVQNLVCGLLLEDILHSVKIRHRQRGAQGQHNQEALCYVASTEGKSGPFRSLAVGQGMLKQDGHKIQEMTPDRIAAGVAITDGRSHGLSIFVEAHRDSDLDVNVRENLNTWFESANDEGGTTHCFKVIPPGIAKRSKKRAGLQVFRSHNSVRRTACISDEDLETWLQNYQSMLGNAG